MRVESEWSIPPAGLEVPSETVEVWRIPLDQPEPVVRRCREILSPSETRRVDRFRAERDRAHHIVGRSALRTILGGYLSQAPGQVAIATAPNGKPFVEGSISFNLTHSGGWAVLAITRERMIGVDLEQIRTMTDRDPIVARFFAPGEAARFAQSPESERTVRFFRLWTRKEAYLKAIGLGLSLPTDGFEIPDPETSGPIVFDLPVAHGLPTRWTVADLPPLKGYEGAIVREGEGWQVRSYHFDPCVASGGCSPGSDRRE